MDEMDYIMHDHEPPTTHPPQQQHRSGCPYWRDHSTRTSPNRTSNGMQHPQYDPVSNLWFSQPAPTFHWAPAPPGGLTPHTPIHHPRAPSESFFSPGHAASSAPGMQSQPPPPHHDPFGPFPFAFSHAASAHHRYGPPPMPAQPNHPTSHQVSFSIDRTIAPHSSLSRTLPPLNPPQQPSSQSNMSSTADSSSSGPGTAGRPGHGNPLPRHVLLDTTTTTRSHPSMPDPDAARGEPNPRASDSDLGAGSILPGPPPVPSSAERRQLQAAARARRSASRLNTGSSDYDSDDEADFPDILDDEQHALRFIERQISANTPSPMRAGDMDEARIRAHQLLRGQLSSKRVASKGALASLQSVDINSLPDSERMCVICYNEFGVPNPEGINEAPLRLPKCKHVFGDHCIKKWFEESDSCPYCRDKVPSEPQVRANYEVLSEFLRNSYAPRGARPPPETRGSASTVTLIRGDAEAYVRFMSQQRDDNRYDGSPPRHTGDRRSPPSDGPELRRRTRARYASVRAMPSSSPASAGPSGSSGSGRPNSFAGPSASSASLQQHSPSRDRFFPQGSSHRPYHAFAGRPHHAAPMAGVEPMGLPPMSTPGFMPPPLLNPRSSHEQQAYPGHINGGPGMQPQPQQPFEPAMEDDMYPRPPPDWYTEMPSGHPMDRASYPTGPNGGGHPSTSRQLWER